MPLNSLKSWNADHRNTNKHLVQRAKLHRLQTYLSILKAIWIEVIVPWGRKVGLSYDFDKRELMHYTRRKCDNNISPSITFDDDNGQTRIVALQAIVRW
ncbi:uncharacterized protein C8R40DRAFT_1105673 [Lentinula edodes]|uniref:uncharacterized protein n=1 Tax=Lentinula edodes TaxID=5353 RepID=UPI001E8D6444|nr:uncharacterized protein C8R40DRAFT_1105673 [Lentinula edodes]KAH7875273.1 hypothetical protein C8R40DRAFT_1105673 [Lentinula edodes]